MSFCCPWRHITMSSSLRRLTQPLYLLSHIWPFPLCGHITIFTCLLVLKSNYLIIFCLPVYIHRQLASWNKDIFMFVFTAPCVASGREVSIIQDMLVKCDNISPLILVPLILERRPYFSFGHITIREKIRNQRINSHYASSKAWKKSYYIYHIPGIMVQF